MVRVSGDGQGNRCIQAKGTGLVTTEMVEENKAISSALLGVVIGIATPAEKANILFLFLFLVIVGFRRGRRLGGRRRRRRSRGGGGAIRGRISILRVVDLVQEVAFSTAVEMSVGVTAFTEAGLDGAFGAGAGGVDSELLQFERTTEVEGVLSRCQHYK